MRVKWNIEYREKASRMNGRKTEKEGEENRGREWMIEKMSNREWSYEWKEKERQWNAWREDDRECFRRLINHWQWEHVLYPLVLFCEFCLHTDDFTSMLKHQGIV